MLEIGCGNLRAAQDTVVRYDLQDRLPHLTLVRNLRLGFLPEAYFTVVHAHSVFSHSPIEIIDECLAHVGHVLAPEGFFDFTFNRTEGEGHHVLREDFYYRTETLIDLAEKHGLSARFMEDWEQTGHKQSKLRLTHP
jgi:predicted TPR repeat methyltransferase